MMQQNEVTQQLRMRGNRREKEVKFPLRTLCKGVMLNNGTRNHQGIESSLKKNQREIKRDYSHIHMVNPFPSANCNECEL